MSYDCVILFRTKPRNNTQVQPTEPRSQNEVDSDSEEQFYDDNIIPLDRYEWLVNRTTQQ